MPDVAAPNCAASSSPQRCFGRDRIIAEDKLYEPLGTAEAIREQSRQRFGRPRRRTPQELPHGILTLLMQLNAVQDGKTGMGLDDKELAFESSPGSLPEGQRRGLQGHCRAARRQSRSSGIYHAREPTNVLPKRMPRGRTPWFTTRFSRVTDGRTTTMWRRHGVRFRVEAKRSAAGGVVDEPRQAGVGRDHKGGDEGHRDDCQHCNLVLPYRLPLLTVAQSFGQERERAFHCGGFHVHSGRATPIIWQSLTGPKYRLSKE
jgi:hypothetical protein